MGYDIDYGDGTVNAGTYTVRIRFWNSFRSTGYITVGNVDVGGVKPSITNLVAQAHNHVVIPGGAFIDFDYSD